MSGVMSERTATRVANGLLLAGAGALAYVVLRDPGRRRAAFRLARTFVTGPLAAFLARELKAAWEESESHRHSMMAR
jgi:hypothetical protein